MKKRSTYLRGCGRDEIMENYKIKYKLRVKYDIFNVYFRNCKIIDGLAVPGVISATKKVTSNVKLKLANYLDRNPDEIEIVEFVRSEYRIFFFDFNDPEDRKLLTYLEGRSYNV